MWFNMLPMAALVAVVSSGIPCEEARLKCAYREGCGKALQKYLIGCSTVLQGPRPSYCPEICQLSLIALVSTEEGKALMECDCSDEYCEDQKRRPEICRPEVSRLMEEPIVSCRVAQWICNADAQCSTAFDYYRRLCKAMFHGKKCTRKCLNSINILRRQDKAQKLKSCKCDGSEDYNCLDIQRNMNKLCFHSSHHHYNVTETHSENEVVKVMVTSNSSVNSVSVSVFFMVLVWFLLLWTR
ncbi:growth arrest-specific protein 1-like [Sitophilus oryzae]|uniref:Growth arrest-specific protein 1-like n=1 Tax=Sitophilus oryzae TaxID=7048 RepID=A0A6J2YBA3_SITOR|nr:growth arrest-specific protein 1-like [Sitophilus oryzae]XP_030760205.1 growth arrest-specific protein 1-like [Sitophilus oryzae]